FFARFFAGFDVFTYCSEGAAANRFGDVEQAGLGALARIDYRGGEERLIVAESAEEIEIVSGGFVAIGRRVRDGVGAQTRGEKTEARDVEVSTTVARIGAAQVDGVTHFVKRAAEKIEGVAVAQIGGASAVQTQEVESLIDEKEFVEFDCACGPVSNRLGK